MQFQLLIVTVAIFAFVADQVCNSNGEKFGEVIGQAYRQSKKFKFRVYVQFAERDVAADISDLDHWRKVQGACKVGQVKCGQSDQYRCVHFTDRSAVDNPITESVCCEHL